MTKEQVQKSLMRFSLAAVVFLAASFAFYNYASKSDDKELRVGLTPWAPFEYIFLAKERGLFDELGVKVRLLEFQTMQDLRRAYVRGQVDGIGSTPTEMVQTNSDSKNPLQLVFFTDFSNGADVVLARKPIETVQALKGKNIGVEVGSLGIFVLYKALEKHGLTLDDVVIIPTEQAQLVNMFKAGSVDAVVTFPPFSLQIENEQKTNTVFSSKEIPRDVPSVLAFGSSVVNERSGHIAKFILAIEKAKHYASQDKNTYKSMADRQQLSLDDFVKSFDGMDVIGLHEQTAIFDNAEYMAQISKAALHVAQKAKLVPVTYNLQGPFWDAKPVIEALKTRDR